MKILVAEDEAVSRRLLEATLRRLGHEPVSAADGREALQILLASDGPDFAILDWQMPGMEGVEVCREIRRVGREPYVYVVLLTSRSTKEDVIAGLDAGADDYLTKPFDVHELRVRLRAGERILELQSQLIAAREELRALATRDALTGLLNRRAILDRLDQEVARSHREHKPLSVVMADIDHFKRINDSHGHPAGDEVLRETAQRIRFGVRPYDVIGRYGGEEFLMVFAGCARVDVPSVANRLREAVRGAPISIGEVELTVTLSLGAATSGPDEHHDAAKLIAVADAALYEAKRGGCDCVRFASPDIEAPPAEAS